MRCLLVWIFHFQVQETFICFKGKWIRYDIYNYRCKATACSLQLLQSSSWNLLPTDKLHLWIVIAGDKRSPQPNLDLISSTLLTLLRDLSQSIHILGIAMFFPLICMWPKRPWCWVQGPYDVKVIMWMQMQVMQHLLLHLIPKHTLFRYTSTVLNVRLYNSLCQPEIYLPRKMKVECDPGLVRDKFSVRYDCEQSREMVACHPSKSFNKL